MTVTTVLAIIGGITFTLTAAARIPAALAEFLHALIPLISAIRELRHTINNGQRQSRKTGCDINNQRRKAIRPKQSGGR